jgi:release factor glutamine methyltransferase
LTLIDAIQNAASQLTAVGITLARLDAEVLLAHVIKKNRAWIFTHMHDPLDASSRTAFDTAVQRRTKREPLQYIVGFQEFWGLDFRVTPDVLVPRPETELIIELAIKLAGSMNGLPTIIDLCTGSGCIAVSLAKTLPQAIVLALDASAPALAIAEENSALHAVTNRLRFFEGDLLQPLEKLGLFGKIDLIVSNPPYVQTGEYSALQPEVRDFEPQLALVAGPQGIAFHQRIIDAAPVYLKRHGALIMEMGMGQADLLCDMVRQSNTLISPAIFKDLAGIERVLVARKA